jgi:acyl carrier protein
MPDTLTTEFDSGDEPDVCHCCGGTPDECGCEDDNECVECKKERLEAEPLVDNGATSSLPIVEDTSPPIPNATGVAPARDLSGLNSNTIARVSGIIAELVGVKLTDIMPDTKMDSELLALDSLDGVELAMALEEEFSIEISDEDAEKAISATVADICKYIDDRLKGERARMITPLAHADPNYVQGHTDGNADRLRMMGSPKWLAGDEAGADSQPHAQFILGYVAGYSGK